MMKPSAVRWLITLGIALFLISQCLFAVPEQNMAIVLQLGEPVGEVRRPGLNFKLPFVQKVVYLEDRLMMFTIDKGSSLTGDFKNFEVDNFVCWRINDPVLFVKTFRSLQEAESRLYSYIFALRQAMLGGQTLREMLRGRSEIREKVQQDANALAAKYGVAIEDVRINRADLPNRQAIIARMEAERKRQANEYRAAGESMSRIIRSTAERDRDRELAQAAKESRIIRAQADAYALDIMGKAIQAAPDFYDFVESLEVYKKSFSNSSQIIFSSDDSLMKYMQ